MILGCHSCAKIKLNLGHDVSFKEIVKTYGTHASRFTGQLSMSQIQTFISKHHSDEEIHGFLDASKKPLQYVTVDKVPLGAVWLRLSLSNIFQ